MRRLLLVAAFASLLVMFIGGVGMGSASAKTGALAGTWTSTDFDGSNQTLTLTGSGTATPSRYAEVYAAFYYDDKATFACPTGEGEGNPAQLVGSAFFDGSNLFVRGAVVCLPGGNPVRGVVGFVLVYDAEAETLTDVGNPDDPNDDIVWSREP